MSYNTSLAINIGHFLFSFAFKMELVGVIIIVDDGTMRGAIISVVDGELVGEFTMVLSTLLSIPPPPFPLLHEYYLCCYQ